MPSGAKSLSPTTNAVALRTVGGFSFSIRVTSATKRGSLEMFLNALSLPPLGVECCMSLRHFLQQVDCFRVFADGRVIQRQIE
jgi:hypothetical protein